MIKIWKAHNKWQAKDTSDRGTVIIQKTFSKGNYFIFI